MIKFLFVLILISSAWAKPSWFDADTKSTSGWTFFCQGEGKNETEAKALAQAECSKKMCLLFGVEVKYSQTSIDNLKEAKSETSIIESCPLVRIVGRSDKKKSVDCSDDICEAFISQFYPMTEYQKEKKRLDNPPISPDFEKTIIVREGNETFKDPRLCRNILEKYRRETGITPESRTERSTLLERAKTDCAGLDYRNVPLQEEFTNHLYANVQKRGSTFAAMINGQFSRAPSLMDKIKILSDLENIPMNKAVDEAKKIISQNFDYLYFREGQMDKYLGELKSCRQTSVVIRKWPKGLLEDISVCVKGQAGETCQTTSLLLLRYAYAGCVCRNGAPAQENSCTQLLVSHMNEECPIVMTEACFQKMSLIVTEKMKFQLNSPY